MNLKKTLVRMAGGLMGAVCLVAAEPMAAATLMGDWRYAIDSFDDGVTGGDVGGGVFEFYGVALRADEDQVTIALNANLSLDGYASTDAEDGFIYWGDLFFNFSGQPLNAANGNLFAIRFAADNDSGVSSAGLYSDVTARSVTAVNSGFNTLTAYNDFVMENGGTPSLADLGAMDPYMGLTDPILNSIETGTKIGELDWDVDLSGLDFGAFGAMGSTTIGFQFDRALFPDGDFVAHVFAECANDGLVLVDALSPVASLPNPDINLSADSPDMESLPSAGVPEPGMMLGLLVAGMLGIRTMRQS